MLLKLQSAYAIATERLEKFLINTDFENQIELAFGNNIEINAAKELIQNLIVQKNVPAIEISSADKINGANGAFAGENNTIYLAQEYLEKSNSVEISALLLEEWGHYLDWQLNAKDSPGDEGAIFSVLVRGENLGKQQLQQLKGEEDSAIAFVDGEKLEIEQQDNTIRGYRGDIVKVNLKEILNFSDSQNYDFTLIQDEVIGGDIVIDNNGSEISEGGEFRETGLFFFAPQITESSTSQTTSAQGASEATITWQESTTGESGTITIEIVDIDNGGYGYFTNGDHAVTFGNEPEPLDIWRQQQRLRYLGFPGRNGNPLDVNGQNDTNTEWTIGLFNNAVNDRNFNNNDIFSSDNFDELGRDYINAVNAPRWIELSPINDELNINPSVGGGPQTERWATSWANEVLTTAATISNTDPVLGMQGTSLRQGGNGVHRTHEAGMDIDIDTPSSEYANNPNRPFYKIHNIEGILYVAAENTNDEQGNVVENIIRLNPETGEYYSSPTTGSLVNAVVHNINTYDNEEVLQGISTLIVDNNAPSVNYNLEEVVSQIEAFTNITTDSSASVRSILYNDPRTWDIGTNNFVRFSSRHGGHFHVNVSPPNSFEQNPNTEFENDSNRENNEIDYDEIEITRLLVFGTENPNPSDYNEHIRPNNAPQPSITLSMSDYMNKGAGRYAYPSLFNVVEEFFEAENLQNNASYNINALQEQLGTTFEEEDFRLGISQYGTDIFSSDHPERSYLFGSGLFRLDSSNASFNVLNGVKTIENMEVRAFDENFDFEAGSVLANIVNLVLGESLDPYELSREELNIEFNGSGAIYENYSEADFNADRNIEGTVSVIGTTTRGLEDAAGISRLTTTGVSYFLNIASDPFLSYVNDNKTLIYGTPGNDDLNSSDEEVLIEGTEGYFIVGGNGNDKLIGDNKNDELRGGDGNDKLIGDDGNDFLFGEEGNDELTGDNGNDIFDVGEDNDFLDGGEDIDVALFSDRIENYDYTILEEDGSIAFTHTRGTQVDGNDNLKNIEFAIFTDRNISLKLDENQQLNLENVDVPGFLDNVDVIEAAPERITNGLDTLLTNVGEVLDFLIDGIDSFLETLQEQVVEAFLGNQLPLVGYLISSDNSSDRLSLVDSLISSNNLNLLSEINFVRNIREAITEKLDNISGELLTPFRDIINDTLDLSEEITNEQLINFLGELLTEISTEDSNLITATKQAIARTFNVKAENIGVENFLVELDSELNEGLNGVLSEPFNPVKQAIYDAVGEDGIDILLDGNEDGDINVDDVQLRVNTPNNSNNLENADVEFDILLGDELELATSLPQNIGLPWLGFELGEEAEAGLTLDYELDLGFGIDSDGVFSFDTTPEEELSVSLTPSLPETTATLGFLQVTAETTEDTAIEFALDLSDNNNDNSLEFNPKGDATIGLDIEAGLNDFDNELLASLPQITTGLRLNWDFLEAGSSPDLQFNDVSLDLGTFFSNFAGPILQSVQQVTEPIRPIIDKLTTPLPVIKSSLLDLAGEFASGAGGIDEDTIKFINQIVGIIELVDFIGGIDTENLDVKINLGDFGVNVNGSNLDNLSNLSNSNLNPIGEVPENLETQLASSNNETGMSEAETTAIEDATTFLTEELDSFNLNSDDSENGLRFPFLEDLSQADNLVNLFLGRDEGGIEFFTYQTPQLGFDFELTSPTIPVFGPIVLQFVGGAGAGAQFKFGYDTHGLVQFAENDFNNPELIADGFFVSRPNDNDLNLELGGFIGATAGASVGIASAAVGGGIGLDVGLGVSNRFGGKIRASNIVSEPPLCLFDVEGSVSAIIFASLKLNFGFYKLTKRFDLADINIIDFTLDRDCEDDIDSYFDTPGAEITPEIREALAQEGIIERQGTDGGDTIKVFARNADSPQDLRIEGLDAEPQDYNDVELIVLDGGEGNDTITLAADVSVNAQLEGGTGDDKITGGRGFDFLTGGMGNDTLNGGGGEESDTAVYADAPAPATDGDFAVIANLQTGIAQDGFGNTDTLIDIENLEGSSYSDRLIGNAEDNILDSGAGDDELIGNGGNDVILAGLGADTIDGGAGIDTMTYLDAANPVYINLSNQNIPVNSNAFLSPETRTPIFLPANTGLGGDGKDDVIINVENIQGSIYDDTLVASNSGSGTIDGYEGNDIIFANSQPDILTAGIGTDWLSYQLSTAGISMSLQTLQGSGGYAEGDRIERAKKADGEDITNPDASFENLEGSQFGDSLLQGDGRGNVIRGLGGDDVLAGESGNDTLYGGAGADSFDGGNGKDLADYSESTAGVRVELLGTGVGGEAQGDTFVRVSESVSTVENLLGSSYGDTLIGDNGNNRINPGLSNGYFAPTREETDRVVGGAGNDTLVIDYSLQDYRALGIRGGFASDSATSGYLSRKNIDNSDLIQDAVSFEGIEASLILGTLKDDLIRGGLGSDSLSASAGNDTLDGGDGNDLLKGEEGDDEIDSGRGNDTVRAEQGNDLIYSGQGNNSLFGGAGNDTVSYSNLNSGVVVDLREGGAITETGLIGTNNTINDRFNSIENVWGSTSEDTLAGDDRNNQLDGGAGNDLIEGRMGADTIVGGQGDDTVSYLNSNESVRASLLPNIVGEGGDAQGDLLDSLENIKGSNFDDFLQGNSGNNSLSGNSGNDTLYGGSGEDVMSGDDGRDRIFGDGGNDEIDGGNGADFLEGNEGNDTIEGDRGNDTLDGGNGEDTAIFSDDFENYDYEIDEATETITITHARGTQTDGVDTLRNIEFARFGDRNVALPFLPYVAWWKLDETSGEIALDSAGTNNGSLINSPNRIDAVVGNGLAFDGIDDFVQIADNNALDFSTGDFSVSAWVKTNDSSGVDVLLDKRVEQSGNNQGYHIYLFNGNLGIQLAEGLTSNSYTNYNSNIFIADGEWHQVTVTVDRDSVEGGKWYLDGNFAETFNPTNRQGSLSNSKSLTLGQRSDSTDKGSFRGSLDEVKLFDKALLATEVVAFYETDIEIDEISEISETLSRNEVIGTDGNDIITGGQGASIITDDGNDTLIYNSINDTRDTVTDFELDRDKFDLSQLLDSFDYTGSDPFADGYVEVIGSGSTSVITIDPDGAVGSDAAIPFVTVQGLAVRDLNNPNNFEF